MQQLLESQLASLPLFYDLRVVAASVRNESTEAGGRHVRIDMGQDTPMLNAGGSSMPGKR